MRLTLAVHPQLYTLHCFHSDLDVPPIVYKQSMYFIAKTREELSIIVPATVQLDSLEQEVDWRCLEIVGPLGFSVTGIMSKISSTLAEHDISIFVISTFDTDYILIKKVFLQKSIDALKAKNYQIIYNKF